ncbi:MAG: hemerythrin-like metal-binding protein [Natrialbaceae archaeon]|jgi:hemerythrin-like metal-binding protein
MSFIEWSDDQFGVGIERVDEQHRRLFELLNELYEAMEEDEGEEAVGDVIAELEDYTYYHFEDEESYMDECGFADECEGCFLAQENAHRGFEQEVSELRELYESDDAAVQMQTLRFLRTWVAEHVAGMDQQIGTFMEEGPDDLKPMEMSVKK